MRKKCEECGSSIYGEYSVCDDCWSSGVWRDVDMDEREEARVLMEIGQGIEKYYSQEGTG